jgi:hypothetical protein
MSSLSPSLALSKGPLVSLAPSILGNYIGITGVSACSTETQALGNIEE